MGKIGVAWESEQESEESSIAIIKAVGAELQTKFCLIFDYAQDQQANLSKLSLGMLSNI